MGVVEIASSMVSFLCLWFVAFSFFLVVLLYCSIVVRACGGEKGSRCERGKEGEGCVTVVFCVFGAESFVVSFRAV